MDKAYEHKKYEKTLYEMWENTGAFLPNSTGEPYTIMMPPPNSNDDLHIGHARFVTVEDVLIRYHRMKGKAVLWLPGADHAGIETQFVFEKKLKEQGKSRFDYDRGTLYKMVWDFVQKNKVVMENQLRSLGASCDWSREKFTLDPEIVKVVYQTFKKLHEDGLIYRGERLVNYCTRCGTAYSELEVDHVEKEGEIYTLDYGIIKIATTRPETIFADVAVAVNPNDKKYAELVGKMATIPLINRQIPIIADEAVELGLGTDALKVTPAHDFTDWEIGDRHNLERLVVVGNDGKIKSPAPEKYVGLFVNEARKLIIEDLASEGKLIKTDKKTKIMGICYRCKGIIEPLPCPQWFIKVESLVVKAKEAVEKKETTFAAEKFEKIYMHWLSILKDWNISRQIVWGIQIPAWQCKKCENWIITDGETPAKCKCGSEELVRDSDTFDTWFSSGQWPFATLMAGKTDDFEKFYPTSVMETAYDILPFWVMRMMLLGLYATGKVPFKKVLIHGLVRDKAGQKISKSKGNVINPLLMTDKYGTDALRMALVWGALVENDIALSEDNIKGQRNFANKIWNIGRLVTMMYQSVDKVLPLWNDSLTDKLENEDKQILEKMKEMVQVVNKSLEEYRLSEAAEAIYNFMWHELADVYLEKIKNRREDERALIVVRRVYIKGLKLLHPFMPFVTEAIWQEMRKMNMGITEDKLILAKWPED